ncbi:hypothetical protein M0805_003951 [Coniferiporia weirii]|nr:hypothetical protein M0805_003951 [Coniferiporia weirii]
MSSQDRNQSSDQGKSSTLRKGQACTCCRRRKQKCDGVHPICTQCSTNGRELDCEYSDGYTPTRTEILQEYLASLQNRLDVLERARGQRSLPPGGITAQYDAMIQGASLGQTNPSFLFTRPSDRWWEAEVLPPQVAHILVNCFLQHAYQVGWVLDNNRFLAGLSLQSSSAAYPHGGLINAVYLWGAHFFFAIGGAIDTPALPQMQTDVAQAFSSRASAHLQMQIEGQSPQKGLHAVQAEILLATYLFSVGGVIGGRTLGTEYHVNAAVSLALGFGMHRIVSQGGSSRGPARHGHGSEVQIVAPPLDAIEEGERIAVFWRVFCLDRQWAIVQGRPSSLRLDGDRKVAITTPWPVSPEAYEQGSAAYSSSRNLQPLLEFMEGQGNSTSGFSHPALSVKACLLCENASHHAALPSSDSDNRRTDAAIFTFISSLEAFDASAPVALKARFVSIHATAYLSFVRLHERNAPTDASAYARCVQAARYISALLGNLKEEGVMEIDPFVMPCFVISCKVLMREIVRTRQIQAPQHAQSGTLVYTASSVLVAELERAMSMMSILAPIYPVVVSQLNSLRETRISMGI